MILADKIVKMRKKNGWSQEELADKMNVSRQAVSKWESAQAIPDLEKILQLSTIFGVTTDYLIKDEIVDEEYSSDNDGLGIRRVTLAEANEYIAQRRKASYRIALGVFLCIISPIVLFILGAASEEPSFNISENLACGIGFTVMLLIVSVAVGIFLSCGFKNAPYEFLEKEVFETEYGVVGMASEKEKEYRSIYIKYNIIGICLCVISPIALFIGALSEKDFFCVIMLAVMLVIAGIGVAILVTVGVYDAGIKKLLQKDEFSKENKSESKLKEAVASVYWMIAAAVYLGWSFVTEDWEITWVVWPIAGVLFGATMVICNIVQKKNDR